MGVVVRKRRVERRFEGAGPDAVACAGGRGERVGLHDEGRDAADRVDLAAADDQLVACGDLWHATPWRNITISSGCGYVRSSLASSQDSRGSLGTI